MTHKKKSLTIGVALICILSIASAWAYFTADDNRNNTFVIGEVKIDIEEPNWTPPSGITPGEIIAKDPSIRNTGKNDAYIFAEVIVPKRNIYAYDPDTLERLSKEDVQLFQLNSVSAPWTGGDTTSSSWVKISEDISDSECNKFIFAYGSTSACTNLSPQESTDALFNSVTFCYAVEGQGLDEEDLAINVNAYAIQSESLPTSNPSEVWALIQNQQS